MRTDRARARGRRSLLVVLAVLGAAVALPPGSAAQARSAGSTDRTGTADVVVTSDVPVFWTGTASASGATSRLLPACRETGCDRLRLRVQVPAELQVRPGGIQVAVRWSDPTASLGLYAVRGGRVVASSTGQIGTAQALLLPKTDAVYDLWVSLQPFDPSVAPSEVAYEGLAENEDDPPVQPLREMLPDLQVLPQRGITFDVPPPFFDDVPVPGTSCFSSEVEEQGARTCLRLGQAAENAGAGPVDLRYSTAVDGPEDEVPAVQRVYRSDGTSRDTVVGVMHHHAAHDHYHFEGFSQSELYRLDRLGRPAARPAAVGRKNGFCMADTEMARWGLKGDDPQTYPAPRCLLPYAEQDGRSLYAHGISTGWADEYSWTLPDQMVEVSGLRDGRYRLVTRVDADDQLEESHEGNNCTSVDIELTDLRTRPVVAVVGPSQSCS